VASATSTPTTPTTQSVNKRDVVNDLTLVLPPDWLKLAHWPVEQENVCCVVSFTRFPNPITTTQQTCCGLLATHRTILTCQSHANATKSEQVGNFPIYNYGETGGLMVFDFVCLLGLLVFRGVDAGVLLR